MSQQSGSKPAPPPPLAHPMRPPLGRSLRPSPARRVRRRRSGLTSGTGTESCPTPSGSSAAHRSPLRCSGRCCHAMYPGQSSPLAVWCRSIRQHAGHAHAAHKCMAVERHLASSVAKPGGFWAKRLNRGPETLVISGGGGPPPAWVGINPPTRLFRCPRPSTIISHPIGVSHCPPMIAYAETLITAVIIGQLYWSLLRA